MQWGCVGLGRTGRIAPYGLALVLIAAGCAQPQPRTPDEIARKAKIKRPGWVERLELSEDKADRATEIWASVSDELDGYNTARLALLNASLEDIREGELDRETLEPLARRTVDEFERALPAFVRGLNELHALLNDQERKRLVEMVSSKTQTKEEKVAERNDRIAKVLDLNAGQKTRLYPLWLGLGISHLGLLNELKRDAKTHGRSSCWTSSMRPNCRWSRIVARSSSSSSTSRGSMQRFQS